MSGHLRMAKSERFDLYLLDDLFEDGAGLELLAHIRTFDRERPAIIYSADGRESAHRESIEGGAQAFIAKPADIELLVNTIRLLVSAGNIVLSRQDRFSTEFDKYASEGGVPNRPNDHLS